MLGRVDFAHIGDAGARSAGYVLVRLPHERKGLFEGWVCEHCPGRAKRVLSLLRHMHGGEVYDSTFHSRQRGVGPFAALLQARFQRAQRAQKLDRSPALDSTAFVRPATRSGQLDLWSRARD